MIGLSQDDKERGGGGREGGGGGNEKSGGVGGWGIHTHTHRLFGGGGGERDYERDILASHLEVEEDTNSASAFDEAASDPSRVVTRQTGSSGRGQKLTPSTRPPGKQLWAKVVVSAP